MGEHPNLQGYSNPYEGTVSNKGEPPNLSSFFARPRLLLDMTFTVLVVFCRCEHPSCSAYSRV